MTNKDERDHIRDAEKNYRASIVAICSDTSPLMERVYWSVAEQAAVDFHSLLWMRHNRREHKDNA